MDKVSPRIVGCGRLSLVTLLCDATKAWTKVLGCVCLAGTAAEGGGTLVDGTGVESAADGENNSVCQSNGMAEPASETISDQ